MEEEPFFSGKRSRMSSTLLSNYILSISLLKNIARYFSDGAKFNDEFQSYVMNIREIEKTLRKMGSYDIQTSFMESGEETAGDISSFMDKDGIINGPEADFPGVAVSFLISQHKREILNQNMPYKQVLKQTFNREFLNMLQVCIFVPFLHSETPKPGNVPKITPPRDSYGIPHVHLYQDVMAIRTNIHKVQMQRRAQMLNLSKISTQVPINEHDQSLSREMPSEFPERLSTRNEKK